MMRGESEGKIYQWFEKTINASFELERSDNTYRFSENGVPYEFISPSNKCFAFRIDGEKNKPMLYVDGESKTTALFGGSPPTGVAKMCDAIFVMSDKGRDYIISVEIKTEHEEEYKKQISNGWRFCEWMMNLLRDHGHYSKDAVHLGLLVWRAKRTKLTKRNLLSRRYERKGTHRNMAIFEASDSIISLKTLLKSARNVN